MKTEAEIRKQLTELTAAREQREMELIAIKNQEAALLFVLGELPAAPAEQAPQTEGDADGSDGAT